MLIQRWMRAGYNCHNLIGDFIATVRPGERQKKKNKNQLLHSITIQYYNIFTIFSHCTDL